MELISIEQINERYLFYNDLRSCKNWLKAKGVLIIKLGKKYFVKAEQFKAVINIMAGNNQPINAVRNKSVKHRTAPYYEIYNDLLRNINEL